MKHEFQIKNAKADVTLYFDTDKDFLDFLDDMRRKVLDSSKSLREFQEYEKNVRANKALEQLGTA